jgi:hypothetical protein
VNRFFRWLGTLVDEEALFRDTSVKIIFWVGALMVVSATLFLAFAHTELDPVLLAAAQIALGFLLAVALPVSRLRPDLTPRILAAQGILICVLVCAYVPFMWYATWQLAPGLAAVHRSYRVSHAPGVLAVALGYGFRLAYDFGATGNRAGSVARRLGFAGIAIGALADAFVLYLVMSTFSRMAAS